jgi:hypothetical protein
MGRALLSAQTLNVNRRKKQYSTETRECIIIRQEHSYPEQKSDKFVQNVGNQLQGHVKLQVLTAATMTFADFWNVAPSCAV